VNTSVNPPLALPHHPREMPVRASVAPSAKDEALAIVVRALKAEGLI
jgi:hypothetical protein